MSAYRHRQPIWNWSSVVLLSTLLLSPVAAAALLHAVGEQTRSHPAATTASTNPAGETTTAAAPRRNTEDDEAQSAAKSGPRSPARLDEEPEPLTFHPGSHRSLVQALLFVALLSPAALWTEAPAAVSYPLAAELPPLRCGNRGSHCRANRALLVGPSRAPPCAA